VADEMDDCYQGNRVNDDRAGCYSYTNDQR